MGVYYHPPQPFMGGLQPLARWQSPFQPRIRAVVENLSIDFDGITPFILARGHFLDEITNGPFAVQIDPQNYGNKAQMQAAARTAIVAAALNDYGQIITEDEVLLYQIV